MVNIYQGALVTFVAVSAYESGEGFLRVSEKSSSPLCVPYWESSAQMGSLFMRCEEIYRRYNEAIDQRAWTFQEALLSPRCLSYSRTNLQYECQHHTVTFGASINFPEDRFLRLPPEPLPLFLPSWTDPGRSWMWLWASITYEYSQRRLSVPSDRLTALSAIVDSIHLRLRIRYLAGLWDEPLLPGLLLWRCLPSTEKSPVYVAPSWSWASRSSRASYPPEIQRAKPLWYGVELTKVVIIPERATLPHGSIRSARLEIRGRVQMGLFAPANGIFRWDADGGKRSSDTDQAINSQVRIELDYPVQKPISLLILATTSCVKESNRREIWINGLVISETDEKGTYRRVGMFTQGEEHEFRSCDLWDIILI